MFDPKRHLSVAKRFAAVATSERPESVKELTGGLDMINSADDIEMLLALLRHTVRDASNVWRVYLAPATMAEVPMPGMYVALVTADKAGADTHDETYLAEPIADMRLFRFEQWRGNEQNCSLVEVADREEWDKRQAEAKQTAEDDAFDMVSRTYLMQHAKAAYEILERAVAKRPAPSHYVVRQMAHLKWALENDGQMGETDSEMYGIIDGLPHAMAHMLKVAVALDIKPSTLLADAEARVIQLLG